MTPFRSFSREHPGQPRLPLMHGTTVKTFFDLEKQPPPTLKTSRCRILGEDLLYLFYGKPAYVVSQNKKPETQTKLLPVLLVLKPDASVAPKRIFPFDSGAFKNNRFERYTEGFDLEEFNVGPSPDILPHFVTAFFATNAFYVKGEARSGVVVPEPALAVRAYYELITATGQQEFDDRRAAIEVQLASGLTLTGQTLAIIAPERVLDAPEAQALISILGADPIPYFTPTLCAASEFHGVVRGLVNEFLEKEHFL